MHTVHETLVLRFGLKPRRERGNSTHRVSWESLANKPKKMKMKQPLRKQTTVKRNFVIFTFVNYARNDSRGICKFPIPSLSTIDSVEESSNAAALRLLREENKRAPDSYSIIATTKACEYVLYATLWIQFMPI